MISQSCPQHPGARGSEATSAEEIGEQGSVGEVGRRQGEVGVGGVRGDGEVGVAGMEVDGLSAHEHERVAVRFESST